mmetsp:Transcript_53116/g.137374  ORF Transcript_53116/g.137374 Transcript_53116/m.137374 type:complete len:221 (+) Transcript_53116:766-1428(+)
MYTLSPSSTRPPSACASVAGVPSRRCTSTCSTPASRRLGSSASSSPCLARSPSLNAKPPILQRRGHGPPRTSSARKKSARLGLQAALPRLQQAAASRICTIRAPRATQRGSTCGDYSAACMRHVRRRRMARAGSSGQTGRRAFAPSRRSMTTAARATRSSHGTRMVTGAVSTRWIGRRVSGVWMIATARSLRVRLRNCVECTVYCACGTVERAVKRGRGW